MINISETFLGGYERREMFFFLEYTTDAFSQ